MLLVHSFDLENVFSTFNDIVVELYGIRSGRELRARDISERVEVETVNSSQKVAERKQSKTEPGESDTIPVRDRCKWL